MLENREGRRLLVLREQETGVSEEKVAIQTEARSRLRKSGYHELHLIACDFHESVLTLRGRVPTFCLKQVAQTLFGELEGVGEINNRLEVVAPRNSSPEDRTVGGCTL
jgi:hypothetical protein